MIHHKVVINRITGEIVWVRGPSPGSMHDLTMMRHFGIANVLEPGELILADKAYQGHKSCVVPYRGHGYTNHHDDCAKCRFNFMLSGIRILVERSIGRIKRFQCFKQKWRHNLALHPVAFFFVANLCNIMNKFSPL